MEEVIRKNKIRKIKYYFLLIFAVVVCFSVCFISFRISTEAHNAFREAKNIKLAFYMLEIEYYSQGKSIFDDSKLDGMSAGVRERIVELLDHDGEILLTGYHKSARKVTNFIYTTGQYRVIYRLNEAGQDDYTVDYLIPIYHYNGHEAE